MHPILFEIPKIELGNWVLGPIPIRLYGLMIGIGFLVSIWLASRQAKKEGLDPDRIMDMGVYLLLAAIVGSRLFYVLVNLQEFQRNWLEVFAIWKGGLVFYGGLIGAVAVGMWYVRKHKLPLWRTADVVAPYIAQGHMFGRFGCFFAGCCYGSPCSGDLCITFTDSHSLAPLGVSLYPTQLFEAGGELVNFVILFTLYRVRKFDGQIFWLYPALYSILRFVVEFFRGDTARGIYFGGAVSTSQLVSVGMLFLSVFMLWRLGKKEQAKVEVTNKAKVQVEAEKRRSKH